MSFDVGGSLDVVATTLRALPTFGTATGSPRVLIGPYPPKRQLPVAITAYLSPVSQRIVATTLVAAIELHMIRIGIYRGQAEGPLEEDGKALWVVPSLVLDALKADFSLGDSVCAIDEGGIYGATPETEYGEEEIAGRDYWTAHLLVPLIVNADSAVFAA